MAGRRGLQSAARTAEPFASIARRWQGGRVSARSFATDPVWDFSEEVPPEVRGSCVLKWNELLAPQWSGLQGRLGGVVQAFKQVAVYKRFGPEPSKPQTLCQGVKGHLAPFLNYLAETQTFSLTEVTEQQIKDYITRLRTHGTRGRSLAPSSLVLHLRWLNDLYDAGPFLDDRLVVRPTGRKSPARVAGLTHAVAEARRTPPLPDHELSTLIQFALDVARTRAPRLAACCQRWRRWCESVEWSRYRAHSYKGRQFFAQEPHFAGLDELTAELVLVRAACLVLVLFCTGMRRSEARSLRRRCLRRETRAGHGTFWWLNATLFKTTQRRLGAPRAWMCGVVGAEAVQCMESLAGALGLRRDVPLFFHCELSWTRGPLLRGLEDGKKMLDRLARLAGVSATVRPHRLRRSFARNIVRWTRTPITALKEHFQHYSLYMTDWYIGLDLDLITEIAFAREEYEREMTRRFFLEPNGGPGGQRWERAMAEAIASGRLPKDIRTKAGLDKNRSLIERLRRNGALIIPCGDFTYCYWQRERALCSPGELPVPNKCLPTACPNSIMKEEHVEAHLRRKAEFEALLRRHAGPEDEVLRAYWRRQIQAIDHALAPLLRTRDEQNTS